MRVGVRLALVCALVLSFVAAAVAQNPQPGEMRPGAPGRGMDRQRPRDPEAEAALRARIEERFGQRIKAELGLTDQQLERVQAVGRANEQRVRDLNDREMDLYRAVLDQLHQLRPGVAANQDSLGRLLDGLVAARVQRVQSEQQEMRELSQFLTPVQRARLLLMRRQLMNRIEAVRRGMGPGMRQGMGPGMGQGMVPPGMPPMPQDTVRRPPPDMDLDLDW